MLTGGRALRTLLVGAALALPLPLAPISPACASGGARAALVVDTGEDVYRYCVALGDDEVSGAELIVLAGEQHGLTYKFGYGGGAVCMLADVGPTGDDCFEHYPDFWGYWRGDASGGWTWSSAGPASTTVADGDVEGWSWGTGADGSSHPPPPEVTFPSVCPPAQPKATAAATARTPRAKPAPAVSTAPRPAAEPEPRRPEKRRERATGSRARPPEQQDLPDEQSPEARAAPSQRRAAPAVARDRVPASALLSLIVVGALVAVGSLVARLRRRT